MRTLIFSPTRLGLGVSFLVSMIACNMSSSPAPTTPTFSLEYRVTKGLDCAMVEDCGYKIEVAQTGALTHYKDTGTKPLVLSGQALLAPTQMDDLQKLLDETGFFDFPDLLPLDNPLAGAGSATVTYVEWPSRTRKTVRMMKGSPLPVEADLLISRLDSFFVWVME